MGEDGKPKDEGDGTGKKVDKPVEKPDKPVKDDKVEPTPAEKVKKDTEELRAENDAYDKEKLRAETIRAERAVDGQTVAGQEEVKDPDQEMADKLLADSE